MILGKGLTTRIYWFKSVMREGHMLNFTFESCAGKPLTIRLEMKSSSEVELGNYCKYELNIKYLKDVFDKKFHNETIVEIYPELTKIAIKVQRIARETYAHIKAEG